MWTLVRYCHLPSHQKRLLHAALAWVVLSRIGLALFSLPRLQRFTSNARHQSLKGATRDELRWAVLAVARRVPGTRCLARALALHALMARAGLPARLCIGVAKESDSALAAHAWVLHEGVPVFDEPDLERYTLLSAFPA
jgi:hypothetical protein